MEVLNGNNKRQLSNFTSKKHVTKNIIKFKIILTNNKLNQTLVQLKKKINI